MASATRNTTFSGANVYLSRSLVPPEVYDALHDALKLNGAHLFLCSDPSKCSPNDYHVISSMDHEKFEDLRSKGCNLIGPQCVLSCAKEHRVLPKQGYTCCLGMDGVKVLASGFEKEEKAKIQRLVIAMGGIWETKASPDINFVIAKNVLSPKYKYALNVLKKPIVSISWLSQCWSEHRVVPHEPFRLLPFSGLTVCVTRIPADERKEMEKMIIQNGGTYSPDLTKKCTHLVSDSAVGDKYMVARKWGHIHIVTRKWADQSIAKRGCLDEGLYPVDGASKSCNTMKILQKDNCHPELSNTSSYPPQPTAAEDLEATVSQSVPSTSSFGNGIHNKEVCAPSDQIKEGTYNVNQVAGDSETEDDDLYLSDCRILLVGFGEKEESRLLFMIRKGGGTRHMSLSEKLTHIILGSPSEIEKREIRRLAALGVINVVRATWLEECNQAKREVTVSPRHIVSGLLISKDSTFPSTGLSSDANGIKKARTTFSVHHVSASQVSEDKSSTARLSLEKRRVADSCRNGVNMKSIAEIATKSAHSSRLFAANCEHKSSHQEYISGTINGHPNKSSSTFKEKHFCFSRFFPVEQRPEVIEWINQGGGVLIDDHMKMDANFIVESHGLLQPPDALYNCTAVSTHWIRSSLEEGSMQDVTDHIIYSPLRCHIPLPGFGGIRFCISQYEEKDRLLLRNLCFVLGAKFTEKLTKKVTHLLCKFKNGPKYDAACKWGIQSVTAEWITECIRKDTIVPPDSFRPRSVVTQDREAGLCIETQYPTQAAHMVSGCIQSQLPTQSQGSLEKPKERSQESKEIPETSAYGKRLRLQEPSSDDACKKTKAREEVREGCDQVPDVADIIEDLLAQSNKIQDEKLPGPPGCGQSIFPVDHSSILGQNHPSPQPTFGISRHWLNRPQKKNPVSNPLSRDEKIPTFDSFSETQSESQVVSYEEDLTGRQKIIDRIRSQTIRSENLTLTPDK